MITDHMTTSHTCSLRIAAARSVAGRSSVAAKLSLVKALELADGRRCHNNVIFRGDNMVKTALFVRLEAKPGKEAEVEGFLRGGLPIVEEEPATVAWFGIRLGPTTFGIFDAFPDEAGRQAHLSGKVAAALMAKASELLAQPPLIEKVDVLAAKLP
jgi:quinol monooxygenase YgiN